MIGGVASSTVQRLNGKAEPYRTVRRHSRERTSTDTTDNVRPAGTGENLVRTRFALDVPSDAEKRGENALCFS
jgi:hypothetical protein